MDAPLAPDVRTPAPRHLRIRFTGSGSEYFRIWAVNLLLTLVTFGMYLPFAKARRIRYFYANALIDGQALSFHGDPWKMFRGFLLLVGLVGLYGGLGYVSTTLGMAAFLVLVLLWPPLWRAGMRFRLTHTSWRGLRFGFAGSLGGAYQAFLPVGVPMLLLVLLPEEGGPLLKALAGLGALLFNLMVPWTLGLAKRYQHNHYRFAREQARTWLTPSQVYGLSLRSFLLGSIALFVTVVVATSVMGGVLPTQRDGVSYGLFVAVAALVYGAAYACVISYFTAGLQNLVWSSTMTDSIRFGSALGAVALLRLTLKNWLLTVLTLSLYRPFAAVATARLRLEAITIETTADIDGWAGDEAQQNPGAAGDFAGDFFGIDLGL